MAFNSLKNEGDDAGTELEGGAAAAVPPLEAMNLALIEAAKFEKEAVLGCAPNLNVRLGRLGTCREAPNAPLKGGSGRDTCPLGTRGGEAGESAIW
jgi:hypothetical protein